ncbi:hypothetical protein IQ06DRAFT_56964 [Phaeosphaeriaceae sp. SRC1lsM3a]|nr:hypothetical protein IQ06DRAFT_56964 [Stagonospora sp. SRC1lsM3a]
MYVRKSKPPTPAFVMAMAQHQRHSPFSCLPMVAFSMRLSAALFCAFSQNLPLRHLDASPSWLITVLPWPRRQLTRVPTPQAAGDDCPAQCATNQSQRSPTEQSRHQHTTVVLRNSPDALCHHSGFRRVFADRLCDSIKFAHSLDCSHCTDGADVIGRLRFL